MPNVSIWLSDDQLAKLERLSRQAEQAGLRITRSSLVAAAIDAFSLPVRSLKETIVSNENEPASEAA